MEQCTCMRRFSQSTHIHDDDDLPFRLVRPTEKLMY